MMELLWSKNRILETYLNIAEFGDGIFGVEAASRYYFHKNASRLNKSESVWLASILINPKEYQNRKRTPHLNRRINRINHDMELVEVPSRK
ncbi:transglycosylase domain-containing protein, partial [Turicimonas muris]